jgi:hypothetical protein
MKIGGAAVGAFSLAVVAAQQLGTATLLTDWLLTAQKRPFTCPAFFIIRPISFTIPQLSLPKWIRYSEDNIFFSLAWPRVNGRSAAVCAFFPQTNMAETGFLFIMG